MKLIKAMATVAGLTGVSRILGFVRDILTAAILGAGPIADAFFVALKLPNFFRRVTAEGAFSVAFVPLYSGLLEEDKEASRRFASNAFSIMMLFLVPFTVLAIMAMPFIVSVLAPGFADDAPDVMRYDMAVEMSRITFPYLLLMSLTALLGGILNAHDRFAPFASAPIFFNLCLILALLVFTKFTENAGYALSYGIALAGVVQFLWLVYFIRKLKIRVELKRPDFTPNIKKLFKLMGPGVLSAGVVHVNLLVNMIIASSLASGSISYLYYADRLNQLPLGMVGIAVGTALLPMLSKTIAAGDKAETQKLFNRALEVCMVLALPAAAALFVMPETLISTLFERGEFTSADTAIAAKVLMGYAVGLPAYIAVKVFLNGYYSQQDTVTPLKIAAVTTALNITLALLLIKPFGVIGIAIAFGLAGWLQVCLLYRGLQKNEALHFDARFKGTIFKIIFSTAVMAVVLLVVDKYLSDVIGDDELSRIFGLIVMVVIGLIVYAAGVITTGALKVDDLKRYLLKKKAKE